VHNLISFFYLLETLASTSSNLHFLFFAKVKVIFY
jgi:hypothetical protein